MNREIKCRGFDSVSKEWVYGYYTKTSFGSGFSASIVVFDDGYTKPVKVEPESIGQLTGLLDRQGIDIYEGDLVRVTDAEEPYINFVGQVKYGVRGYPAFDLYDSDNTQLTDEFNTLTDEDLTFEIIGNVYETPELLGSEHVKQS